MGGVPATGVRTVLLNVTAAASVRRQLHHGVARRQPARGIQPQLRGGRNIPNLVVVGIGADGKVRLFNQAGTVHLIADVMGYYS